MAQYDGGHNERVASFPPFSKNGPPEPPNGGPTKRNIPKDHPYDARALKPMAKALWAASVALGHSLTAYRYLTRLKSATVSPDGMLGGRGYVMQMQDMRKKLYDACEHLSCISDTLYDEINGPHWKPRLATLDENDAEDVERFVEESQEVLENPEESAEETIETIEKENDGPPKGKKPKAEAAEPGSKVPDGGPPMESQSGPSQRERIKEAYVKAFKKEAQVKPAIDLYASISLEELRLPLDQAALFREANSSFNPDELGGPRVNHIGPAEGDGPWGSYNEDDVRVDDAWQRDEGGAGRRDDWGEDYDYPSEWENDLRQASEAWAQSAVPDSNSDPTPTEAWDAGLGFGARGQGAGGYANPSGEGDGTKGVWGPHSGLPGTAPGSSGDAPPPAVDQAINERHAEGLMPQDVAGPPARSDYYPGPKDNLVQSEWGTSDLPGGGQAPQNQDLAIDIDTGYMSEDVATPYTRYDYTTHNYRPEQSDREEERPWAHDETP